MSGDSSLPSYLYSGAVVTGGMMWYIQTSHSPILYSACLLGLGFAYGGALIETGSVYEGHLVSSVASLALSGTGAYRCIKPPKNLPFGVATFLSGGISLAYNLKKTIEGYDD
jgi:uncharacterized membrane protein (UPF0136 family)